MSFFEGFLKALLGAPKVVAETEWTDEGQCRYRVTIQYSRHRYYAACVYDPPGAEDGPFVSSAILTVQDTATAASFTAALGGLAYLADLPQAQAETLWAQFKGV